MCWKSWLFQSHVGRNDNILLPDNRAVPCGLRLDSWSQRLEVPKLWAHTTPSFISAKSSCFVSFMKSQTNNLTLCYSVCWDNLNMRWMQNCTAAAEVPLLPPACPLLILHVLPSSLSFWPRGWRIGGSFLAPISLPPTPTTPITPKIERAH